MNMADTARMTSNELAENPDNRFREIHKLHAANMESLHNKLDTALKKGDKRIEITNG